MTSAVVFIIHVKDFIFLKLFYHLNNHSLFSYITFSHIQVKSKFSGWMLRQQGPLKHWYPITILHGLTVQKTSTGIFTQC